MVKKKKQTTKISWIFLVGLILVILLGLIGSNLNLLIYTILVGLTILAGICLGFFNIKKQDASKFLFIVLTLVVISFMGSNILALFDLFPVIGKMLLSILNAFLVLFIPTAIIISLKLIIEFSKKFVKK